MFEKKMFAQKDLDKITIKKTISLLVKLNFRLSMELGIDLYKIGQWCGYFAIFMVFVTIIGFVFKWGFRYRLVGVTAFMMVLTGSIFSLTLGLFTPTIIPGAVRYSLVYDNGANQTVITVPLDVSEDAIEPTLIQAANNLFSPGRTSLDDDDQFTVRIRTLLHPESGTTKPLYLGQVRRSLSQRDDENIKVELFSENIALLSQVNNDS